MLRSDADMPDLIRCIQNGLHRGDAVLAQLQPTVQPRCYTCVHGPRDCREWKGADSLTSNCRTDLYLILPACMCGELQNIQSYRLLRPALELRVRAQGGRVCVQWPDREERKRRGAQVIGRVYTVLRPE